MRFRDYNDYEIIDLVKQGSEEALALLVAKYQFLIAKKIGKFNLQSDFDDCFQESVILLYKSVMKFSETFNKSFTRYFEHNLENHLISMLRKKHSYGKFLHHKLAVLVDFEVDESRRDYYSSDDIHMAISELSAFEKAVFEEAFIRNRTPIETAAALSCPVKKVYNAIDRIRKKLKLHLRI